MPVCREPCDTEQRHQDFCPEIVVTLYFLSKMIGLVNSIVFLVVLTASCQASDDAFEAGNQTVSQVELATKIQERVHIYERSIIFWDTQVSSKVLNNNFVIVLL